MRNFRLSLLSVSVAAGMIFTGSAAISAMASSEEVEVILGEDDYEEAGDEDNSSSDNGTVADEDTTSSTEPATSASTEAPSTEPATSASTEAPSTEPATTAATEAPKNTSTTSSTTSGTSSTSTTSGSSSYTGNSGNYSNSSTSTSSYSETTTSADNYEESYESSEEEGYVNFVNFSYDESKVTVTCDGKDVLEAEKSARATEGTIVFQVIPSDGYSVGEVLVDDATPARTTDGNHEYIIENITSEVTNVSISAMDGEENENPNEVVLTVNVNGTAFDDIDQTVTTEMDEEITQGEDYTFSLVPDTEDGFTFDEETPITYMMDGLEETQTLEVSEDGSYTIPEAAQNLHITVNLNNANKVSFFGSMSDYAFNEEEGDSGEGLMAFYKPSESIQFQLTGNGGLGDVTVDQLVLTSLNITAGDEYISAAIPEETGGAQISTMENGITVLVTKDDDEDWPQYTVSLFTADGSDIEGYIDVETQFSDPNEITEEQTDYYEETSDEYSEEYYEEISYESGEENY